MGAKGQLEATNALDGDDYENTDAALVKIKCVVGLDNSDFTVMINGKLSDPEEMRPFDHCFKKTRILDAWNKVGFVPFTLCLKNIR